MSPGTAPVLKSEDRVSHGIITREARHAFGILVEKPLEMYNIKVYLRVVVVVVGREC